MSSLEATLNQVERLASSGAAADVRALVLMLGDEDWQARRAAAEAIARAVCASSERADSETLFEELIAAVCDKTHAGRRAAAIAALEGIGQRALPRLALELQPANASARIALAGVIGNAGGAEAVHLLEPLAHDADTNVAAAAIAALGRTREPAATRILLEQLEAADDWLRFAAVGALGELGDAGAIDRIERLLEEPLMQEAAAAALVEIATIEAATALARHLRAADGALRPAVLTALVSLGRDERAAPQAVTEAVQAAARRAFREATDETTLSDLVRLMASGEHGRAHVYLTALGWLCDVQAVPIIARALADPSLVKTARAVLCDLSVDVVLLAAMLHTEEIPEAELAAALGAAKSFLAIEAAARLSVETTEAETLEASLAALAQGREWLWQKRRLAPLDEGEAIRLAEKLRAALRAAHGRALPEIAETLGVTASALPVTFIDAVLEQLSRSEAEDFVLARLALLGRSDTARVLEEASRAQRHPNATVRIAAIEILSRRMARASGFSMEQHLTDEAAGVRRATTRAMRHGAPTDKAQRALLACLVDEDIWVRAEAVMTLGLLFNGEPKVHARLRATLTASHPLCRVAACDALARQAQPRDWQDMSQMARRDSQAEARRAAVRAFARCPQPRTALAVARHALVDTEWPVRRAGIEVLAAFKDAASLKLLLDASVNRAEEAAVRGAALRALAERDAPETLELACHALRDPEAMLYEDAYAALKSIARTRCAEMQKAAKHCAPRAANILKAVMSDE